MGEETAGKMGSKGRGEGKLKKGKRKVGREVGIEVNFICYCM